ncbi:MAG TPA: hypothetical protein VN047_21640 [Sphingopyxis sp.]|nr:hypothetical protein [Sphingopyxis sp.]
MTERRKFGGRADGTFRKGRSGVLLTDKAPHESDFDFAIEDIFS